MRGVLAVALALLASRVWAGSDGLQEARRAIRELRYEDARPLLESSLARGHHSLAELTELYALRGEVAAVADGPDVGEAEFRHLLVLAPEHAPPSRDTPVFMTPFARARRWVAIHGPLRVQHRIGAPPQADLPTPITISIVNDPLAEVVAARLVHRRHFDEPFTAGERTLRPLLPALPGGESIDYYLEILDNNDNVLAELGSAIAPLHVEVPAATPSRAPSPSPRAGPPASATPPRSGKEPPRGHVIARWTLGAVGLALMGAAIGTDVASKNDYDQLLQSCAPNCAGAPGFDRFNAERNAALSLYPLAAVTLATSVVIFIYDGARYHK
jgi:hypothetical protein